MGGLRSSKPVAILPLESRIVIFGHDILSFVTVIVIR